MDDIVTIIVDYKTISITCKYIKKFCAMLIENDKMSFVIVDNSVVDNYIDDDDFIRVCTLDTYKTDYDVVIESILYRYGKHNVYYLKTDQNGGYARGNNIGAEYITKVICKSPTFFLFTNNDVELLKKTSFDDIRNIFYNDEQIAVVGPRIVEKSGKQTSPRKRTSNLNLLVLYNINLILGNRLKKYIDDVEYVSCSQKTYWVMGCFLFVHVKKFFEVGMFDNRTFLYSEEMILSEKLAKNNYYMYYYAGMDVFHNHSQTINKHLRTNINVKYLYSSHRICCKYYRNAGNVLLALSDTVFIIYKFQYRIKRLIRKIFRIE